MEILDKIPFSINVEEVIKYLHLRKNTQSIENSIRDLLDEAHEIANPKALYKESYIESRDLDSVNIERIQFKSKVLAKNLENAERVFPYVVTAGRELDNIEIDKNDFMRVFCFDAIKEMILESALHYLEKYLFEKFSPGTMAHMNPGSLSDWPISQQPVLFSLFGDEKDLIGVRLTESYLMDPIKSVSGIYFPTEVDFKSCMLCERHPCIKRRAPYNPEMAKKYN